MPVPAAAGVYHLSETVIQPTVESPKLDYHPDRSPDHHYPGATAPGPARCDSHAAAVTGALSQASNILATPLAADLRSADDCSSRTDKLCHLHRRQAW